MATRGSALNQPERGREPASREAAARRERAALGVVDRRQLVERARRRQARVLFFFSGCILAAALAVAAAGHALLASEQVRADALQTRVATALASEQDKQLQRAQLETPTRVLQIAEHRYKMIAPTGVTYLQPVNPGPSVLATHTPHRPSSSAASAARHHRSR